MKLNTEVFLDMLLLWMLLAFICFNLLAIHYMWSYWLCGANGAMGLEWVFTNGACIVESDGLWYTLEQYEEFVLGATSNVVIIDQGDLTVLSRDDIKVVL